MMDLTWRDAILRVLSSASEPMHYTAIAEAIAEQGLRTATTSAPWSFSRSRIQKSRRAAWSR